MAHARLCTEQLKNPDKVQQASREDAAQLAKIRGPELEGSDKSADPELLKKVGPAVFMACCNYPSLMLVLPAPFANCCVLYCTHWLPASPVVVKSAHGSSLHQCIPGSHFLAAAVNECVAVA